MPAMTFNEAMSRAPVRTFQWVTVAVCMLVLVCDGIDLQLLGIVAPLVIKAFEVTRSAFGIAMSAALVGFGVGAWIGGWLGDTIGRRWTLVIAALIFALATAGASQANGVWEMAAWRVVSGVGFGSAYANALSMAGEWMPERWRPITVATLAVGTPVGGTIVGWLAPMLAASYGWRGAFVALGLASLAVIVIILAVLRDSPNFFLTKGRPDKATRAARRALGQDIELAPERSPREADGGPRIGVLDPSNLRLNVGVAISFSASAMVAYAVLTWATTFLTPKGFTLPQASHIVAVAGITSMIGSVAAGVLARLLGTRILMAGISATLLVLIVALAYVVETLAATPSADERFQVLVLICAAAAVFSAAISAMYVIMTAGYPASCRTAGIGFGIFMSRVGAISATGFGGTLLDFGTGDSVLPFFGVLAVCSVLVSAAAFVVDRHLPPAWAAKRTNA